MSFSKYLKKFSVCFRYQTTLTENFLVCKHKMETFGERKIYAKFCIMKLCFYKVI